MQIIIYQDFFPFNQQLRQHTDNRQPCNYMEGLKDSILIFAWNLLCYGKIVDHKQAEYDHRGECSPE